VFAGAAREAVFSNPEVIRRIRADFVPVALKAALVNQPGHDDEGRLYREIGRSKPAPQGICVVNSAGKVLHWALMFDDDQSVLAFLDHSLDRFEQFPDARRPVPAERYMRFPTARLDDIGDTGEALPLAERHSPGKSCPAKPPLPPGTLVARLFGRALAPDGKPAADTVSQEQYVEDRFEVPVATQEAVAHALAGARTGRARIPDELGRLCVTYAYLGQLDVRPLSNPCGGASDLRRCEFWADSEDDGTSTIWRLHGESEVFTDEMANAGPGDSHEVKLTWQGIIETNGKRVSRLLLTARGTEKLRFGSARSEDVSAVASLPAGRRIDIACPVRYGISGETAHAEKK
jgi:hypothetical protein